MYPTHRFLSRFLLHTKDLYLQSFHTHEDPFFIYNLLQEKDSVLLLMF